MKLYNIGLVVGRFQMLHKGHEDMIRRALELCDKVVVYIGSSQASGTTRNPYSYIAREGMIEKVFESEMLMKKLLVRPLPDIGVGNNDIWGRYVLGAFEAEFHKQPDLYLTGCEKERPSWFTNSMAPEMDELRISRHKIECSASECRELMKADKYEEWCKMVPTQLIGEYKLLRGILLSAKEEK